MEYVFHFLLAVAMFHFIHSLALDLKNGNGDIYQGVLKSGKPDCTISVEDDVITNIFLGKEDPIQVNQLSDVMHVDISIYLLFR